MKRAFRTALIVALLATLAASVVPFSEPIDASFQLDNPPLWLPTSAFLSLIGLPTALVAFVGLYRLKRWSRPLGVFVGALSIVAFVVLAVVSPLLEALAPLALALLVLALIAWLVSLSLAYGKGLSEQFGS